ncbi:hypothetical protein [Brevibacillus choshinensis]|nr:hypothetical protein [Brevibacillus choshinensis]
MKLHKIMIANRGEIAWRIDMKTLLTDNTTQMVQKMRSESTLKQ